MARTPSEPDPPLALWKKLTWDDVSEWAGGKTLTRGKSYFSNHHVTGLARTADGMLLAWVQGTERYATHVRVHAPNRDGEPLTSECSCPVGRTCKHAVAVVLTYLDVLKKGNSLPPVRDNDPRWDVLQGERDGDDEEFDEYEEDDDDYLEEERSRQRARMTAGSRGAVAPSTSPRSAKPDKPPTVGEYIASLTEEQLRALVVRYSTQMPEVKKDLTERAAVASGNAGVLVREARKELRRVTAEEAWVNGWTGEGSLPDYAGLRRRFEALFEIGEYDALLELGRELLESGTRQVEMSHDEGETASAVAECLNVVFRAVPLSARSNPDKLLYAFEMAGEDEYDLADGSHDVLEQEWSKADWSAVADALREQLPSPATGGDEWTRSYRRDRATNAVIRALDHAGRSAEATKLCETEARRTLSYERLVSRLLGEGRDADAERWAKEGMTATQAKYPGIAGQLRDHLQALAAKRKDPATVAAYIAEKFFERPSVSGLSELTAAAKKAGCEAEVRAAALHFLETGERPKPAGDTPKKRGKSADPVWPLPVVWQPVAKPEPNLRHFKPLTRQPETHFGVLIDLALKEDRTADALGYYDRWAADKRGRHESEGYATRIADAVADTHPDRAIAIYKRQAEAHIARTSPSAYQEARRPLKKLRDLCTKQKRQPEWSAYSDGLRTANARKRRFIEVLDGLAGKPILDG